MRIFLSVIIAAACASAFAQPTGDAAPKQPAAPEGAAAPAQNAAEEFNSEMKSLFDRNPFGKSSELAQLAGQNSKLTEPPKGLELRAIYCVDKKWFFSISDSALKAVYTLQLGKKQEGNCPYYIDFYDDETNSVSISNNVGTYTLTLKTPDEPTGKAVSAVPADQKKPAAPMQTMRISNGQNTITIQSPQTNNGRR